MALGRLQSDESLLQASPRQTSWGVRALAAATMVVAFSLVGHSLTASRDAAAREGLDSDRMENRFAARQSETQTNSVIGFVILGALGAVCWMQAPRRELQWNHALLLTAAMFVGWSFASVSWSIEPGLTMRKEGILVFMLMAAFGMAARFELEDFLWIAILVLGTFVIVGVLAEVRYGTLRPWRGTYRFTGTVDANDQGLQCALLSLCAALARWPGRDWPWLRWCLVLLGLGGLWFSKSRTTLVAFLAAAMLGLVLRSRGAHRWLVLSGLLVAASVGGLVYSFASVAVLQQTADVAVMGRSEDVSTLTGRLPLWEEAWKAAQKRPWMGYGYGAYWNAKHVLEYSDLLSWQIPHSHNAYIDMVLAVGGVGLGLYLAWTLASIASAYRRYEASGRRGELFAVCLLVLTLVHGASESKIPGAGMGALMQLTVLAMLTIKPLPWATAAASERRGLAAAPVSWRSIRPVGAMAATHAGPRPTTLKSRRH